MCGIYGQATLNPKNIDPQSIKLLGILNESRGRDSCGISYDGEIFYGIDSKKIFTDFIKNHQISVKKYPVVIGHNRKSSVGVINERNTHPFGFGEHDQGFKFIICHNGTLKNHRDLAEKYKISDSYKLQSQHNPKTKVEYFKTDSEILGNIIYKQKSFDVLEEYEGKAALAFTNTEEPNVLYLYSGASKEWKHSKEVEIERPLHVYVKSKNNMFFSSEKEPLEVISGGSKNIFPLEGNIIYKITNGDFMNAEKIKIHREYIGKETNNYTNPAYAYENYNDYPNPNAKKQVSTNLTIVKPELHILDDQPIESFKKIKGKIYFNKLRYFRNGHLINGIYVYIVDFGFYFVGDKQKDAEIYFNNHMVNKYFSDKNGGEFKKVKSDEKDRIIWTSNNGFGEKENKYPFYYFKQGIHLLSNLDYEIMNTNEFTISQISHMSKHPIVDLKLGRSTALIIKEGKPYTGKISEVCSDKVYYVKYGDLKEVKPKTEIKSTVVLPIEEVFNNSFLKGTDITNQYLKTCIDEMLEDSIEEVKTKKEENQNQLSLFEIHGKVKKIIEDNLEDVLLSIALIKDELEPYKQLSDVENVIGDLDLFEDSIQGFKSDSEKMFD